MSVAEPKTQAEMIRMVYRGLYGDGNGNKGLIAEMKNNHAHYDKELEKRVNRSEFRWIVGGLTALNVAGLTVIGWLVV